MNSVHYGSQAQFNHWTMLVVRAINPLGPKILSRAVADPILAKLLVGNNISKMTGGTRFIRSS